MVEEFARLRDLIVENVLWLQSAKIIWKETGKSKELYFLLKNGIL
jgi:hypothetical protein